MSTDRPASDSLPSGVRGIVLTCPAWLGGPPGTAGSERPMWVCLSRPRPRALRPGIGCPPAVEREGGLGHSPACPLPPESQGVPAHGPRCQGLEDT